MAQRVSFRTPIQPRERQGNQWAAIVPRAFAPLLRWRPSSQPRIHKAEADEHPLPIPRRSTVSALPLAVQLLGARALLRVVPRSRRGISHVVLNPLLWISEEQQVCAISRARARPTRTEVAVCLFKALLSGHCIARIGLSTNCVDDVMRLTAAI